MRPARPPRRATCRSTRGVAALLFAALTVLLLAPAGAAAHASLEASTPAKDALLDTAPTEVELVFSGTVVAGAGAVQVFAPDGDQVQSGAPSPAKGSRIVQPIESVEEPGTYGVSYRVSSEDGHVINGSFTFSVGEESQGGGAAASRDAGSVDRSLQVAFSVTRFIEVVALLVAAGGGIFACALAPGWRPRLVVAAIVVLLLAYGVGLVLTTAILRGGGIGDALSAEALGMTGSTPFGRSLVVRAIIAVVALAPALLLRHGPPLAPPARAALAVVFVGLAGSLSLTGHAVTTEPTWLRLPLDMLHVTAAAIWLGGLLQLAILAPFAAQWLDEILRFSRIAFASVVVLLLTGVYATFAELGTSFGDLVDSTYGRIIVAKVALYLGTMPLAFNNMSAFVPAIARRPDDAPAMLRQYVWREFALVVTVVALTVWLIATPQP